MKKIIITITVLVAILVAGVLNGMEFKADEVEKVTLEQVYVNQYPDPMPTVIFTAHNFVF